MHSIIDLVVPTIQGLAAPLAGGLAWSASDAPLLIAVPLLLLLSGFVSGSETALFGLSEAHRLALRHRRTLAGSAIETLLADRGMLLITILLTNTTVNVLYFVITSVLLMRSGLNAFGESMLAVGFLMLIVLIGEIAPKVVATRLRMRYATIAAPLLLPLHGIMTPVRLVIREAAIAPLSRLTAPAAPPPPLSDDELASLIEVSAEEGILARQERRLLRDVLDMRKLRVRDVMTPRLELGAVPVDATRTDVARMTRMLRRTKMPVYERDLDHVVGILHVKRFLFDRDVERVDDPRVMTPATFVPELATLDQLLDHFRRTQTQSALVVDEYGGTEGLVAIEDVVEELVGDIVGQVDIAVAPPRLVGFGRWEMSGAIPVRDFNAMFNVRAGSKSVSTLSGLITERLGRSPEPGDAVEIQRLRLEVESTARNRVATVLVTIQMTPDDTDALDAEESP